MAVEIPSAAIGWQAPDFDLEGTDGRRYRLAGVRGPKGTLVMFICNHCPYVQAVLNGLSRAQSSAGSRVAARTLRGDGADRARGMARSSNSRAWAAR
ncbi:MAG TPA: redoxin domain-containing protein [Aliidongia sp.]|nr:redoxin domain-containing protein [Aliidongia sp.]